MDAATHIATLVVIYWILLLDPANKPQHTLDQATLLLGGLTKAEGFSKTVYLRDQILQVVFSQQHFWGIFAVGAKFFRGKSYFVDNF